MAMAEELPTPPALPSTDAEGRGALPAPEPERRDLAGDRAKWLTAAALVLAVAGGYWAFAQNHQGKLEQARALSEAKRQTPDREAKPAAEQRPAQAPQHGAEAGRASAQTARRDTQAAAERAETARKRIEPAVQTAAVPDAPPRSLANAPAAAAGVADGLYAGPICYGPAAAEPPRCFRAQATLSRGRIAGQWPGRDPGVTMVMAGEVSASGEAKMRVHAEKRDGTRAAAIDLTGTLKEGRLDATGSFRNGRTATLNWRKSATGSR